MTYLVTATEPAADKDPWSVDPMDIPLFGLDSSRS